MQCSISITHLDYLLREFYRKKYGGHADFTPLKSYLCK